MGEHCCHSRFLNVTGWPPPTPPMNLLPICVKCGAWLGEPLDNDGLRDG